jgi:hypothetical protein
MLRCDIEAIAAFTTAPSAKEFLFAFRIIADKMVPLAVRKS